MEGRIDPHGNEKGWFKKGRLEKGQQEALNSSRTKRNGGAERRPQRFSECLAGSSSAAAIAVAAIAAVSARKTRGPRLASCQPCSRNRRSSSSVQPPSGPQASASSLDEPEAFRNTIEREFSSAAV